MNVIICPGMHEVDLTKSFISGLSDFNPDIFSCLSSVKILIYLGNNLKTLSAFHILNFLFEKIEDMKSPIVFIAFSAGVVGGLQSAYLSLLMVGAYHFLVIFPFTLSVTIILLIKVYFVYLVGIITFMLNLL